MVVQSCLERVLLRAVLAGKAFHVSVFVHVSDVVVLVYYAQTEHFITICWFIRVMLPRVSVQNGCVFEAYPRTSGTLLPTCPARHTRQAREEYLPSSVGDQVAH